MEKSKRQATTVYLEPRIAKAVKVKAALNERSVSDLVNEALAQQLKEDEEDLRIARERRKEKTYPFEDLVKKLKRDGLI